MDRKTKQGPLGIYVFDKNKQPCLFFHDTDFDTKYAIRNTSIGFSFWMKKLEDNVFNCGVWFIDLITIDHTNISKLFSKYQNSNHSFQTINSIY